MHIGSTVRGEIDEKHDALDAIEAVLPAGTLSGAPKIRACQLIGELENNKRGIYGGALDILILQEIWIPVSPSVLHIGKMEGICKKRRRYRSRLRSKEGV